jgi:hypothetical protein
VRGSPPPPPPSGPALVGPEPFVGLGLTNVEVESGEGPGEACEGFMNIDLVPSDMRRPPRGGPAALTLADGGVGVKLPGLADTGV